MSEKITVHTSMNEKTSWFILPNKRIYGGIHDFQYTTTFSNTIDALMSMGLNVHDVETFFQNLQINVEDYQADLYLKYGITDVLDKKATAVSE